MSIAPTMEVWSQAHAKSDSCEHHDAMRMFWAVEANLIQEAEVSAGNTKIKLITAKLLKQVTAELNAYTELMEGNYYVTLGVSTTSSSSEVKKAYRKLAMKHHPDKSVAGGCPGADKIFPMIQNAYECLSDASARKNYRPEVDLRACLMKVRAAGRKSQSSKSSSNHTASSNENNNPNSYKSNNAAPNASHKYPYSRPPKQQPRSYTSSNTKNTENRSYANYKDKNGKDQGDAPRPQQKYYSNWKDQWAAEQATKQKEQEERRKKNQQTYDDYYYQQQHKWERRKKEEEADTFRRRMTEIQRKKKVAEERRKRKEAEAKAESERRRKEREQREALFKKQREEEERAAKLKKIVKLHDLRGMKAKEIKERLVVLGHTVINCIEKEDILKKYCVVTGQLYKPAVVASSNTSSSSSSTGTSNTGGADDGSYFAFEQRIRAMSVKELKAFTKERGGNVLNLLEKSEIFDAALLLYKGVESGGVKKAMGRTQFAFHGVEDEKEEKEEEEEEKDEHAESPATTPSPDRKKLKPVISTVRMRQYENRFDKEKKERQSKKIGREADDKDDGVTLEDVVNAYRTRVGRTAFGRAGMMDNDDEGEEKEVEEEEKEVEEKQDTVPESPRPASLTQPRTPSPEPLSKDELKKVYEDMYKMDSGNTNNIEESKSQDDDVAEEPKDNTSPVVSTKWETTNRGKDFLMNGMKWDKEEGVQDIGEGDEEEEGDNDDTGSFSSSEGVEWEPMSRPLPKHTVNLTPAEAAFIARQQLQWEQEAKGGNEWSGDDGDDSYKIDDDAWERIDNLNATLPNFTIREEVNFWLHGSQEGISEADYLVGESEEEDGDEDEDGIDWKAELGEAAAEVEDEEEDEWVGNDADADADNDNDDKDKDKDKDKDDFSNDGVEDVTPKVNEFWGHRK